MANIPGNEQLPTTTLRSQRSHGSNGSASGGGGGVVSATLTTGSSEANAEFQALDTLRDGDLVGGGGDDTPATTAAAAPSPPLPHSASSSPSPPRGPSQYLVHRRRRQLLAMVRGSLYRMGYQSIYTYAKPIMKGAELLLKVCFVLFPAIYSQMISHIAPLQHSLLSRLWSPILSSHPPERWKPSA